VSPGLTLKKKVGDMVPKLLVEEKEQELLVKEETLQVRDIYRYTKALN